MPIARAAFCDVLDEEQVDRALGGQVTDTAHYGNGDEAEIAPGYTDVSHEFNCTFEGGDGATARAWLFARPVDTAEATAMVRRTQQQPGCTFPESIGYGRPTLTSVCEAPEPAGAVSVRLQGLFGDSWLSCEVTLPEPEGDEARARARDWCVEVATSLSARP